MCDFMKVLSQCIEKQREFFKKGTTKNVDFRIQQLNLLKNLIIQNEKEIMDALYKDLHKSEFEAYSTEIGMVLSEISYTLENIRKWSVPEKVKTPITNFKSTSYIYPEPYGNTLIIAPWNYPFQLCFAPLVGSMAAGNTAIIKPSSTSHHTSDIIEKIINENFDEGYIHVIAGEESKKLIDEKFDYIFYTGSPSVGRIIMEKAAKNLTPVTLELGGKSPCIVDNEGNLDIFAKRIVWGKFLNAGQTCVAPDYLMVQKDIKDELVSKMINCINTFFTDNPMNTPDYVRIINEKHFDRLVGLLKGGNILYGGEYDKESLYISPTLIDGITWEHPVMNEEIFGPIFPILEYESLDEVIDIVNNHPKPLALYFFSSNKEKQEKVLNSISFGGGCINDTIMHLSSPYLPFGGVGTSGMGSYHGNKSFDTFTHYKSILNKSTKIDLNHRYPPYEGKLKTVKKYLK